MDGHILAQRWAAGEKTGFQPVEIVRYIVGLSGDDYGYYLARFEDGHEAAAYGYELRASEQGWLTINVARHEALRLLQGATDC